MNALLYGSYRAFSSYFLIHRASSRFMECDFKDLNIIEKLAVDRLVVNLASKGSGNCITLLFIRRRSNSICDL